MPASLKIVAPVFDRGCARPDDNKALEVPPGRARAQAAKGQSDVHRAFPRLWDWMCRPLDPRCCGVGNLLGATRDAAALATERALTLRLSDDLGGA